MALDTWTIKTLKTLAEKWGLSKAEVMRRAVRRLNEDAEQEAVRPSPREALEWLQNGGGLSVRESEEFREEVHAERAAKRYWWE